jgi:hypothetical protein
MRVDGPSEVDSLVKRLINSSRAACASMEMSVGSAVFSRHLGKCLSQRRAVRKLVSCPGDFVSTDAVHRIGVCPPKRFRGPGVSSNVLAKLAGEIGNRSENATGDDIPLDLGKP